MNRHLVSIVPYEKPLESVRKAVDLSQGLEQLPSNARVYIKPNIVFWTKAVPFPKWGVITTSRVVEDMIILLKERGIDDITIAEGTVTMNPKDFETPAHAFEMQVDGAGTDDATARQGNHGLPLPTEQRAEDANGSAHLADEIVIPHGLELLGTDPDPVTRHDHFGAERTEDLRHELYVAQVGHRADAARLGGQQRRSHDGQRGVLGTANPHGTMQGNPPFDQTALTKIKYYGTFTAKTTTNSMTKFKIVDVGICFKQSLTSKAFVMSKVV